VDLNVSTNGVHLDHGTVHRPLHAVGHGAQGSEKPLSLRAEQDKKAKLICLTERVLAVHRTKQAARSLVRIVKAFQIPAYRNLGTRFHLLPAADRVLATPPGMRQTRGNG
jgi:hypothetical protein